MENGTKDMVEIYAATNIAACSQRNGYFLFAIRINLPVVIGHFYDGEGGEIYRHELTHHKLILFSATSQTILWSCNTHYNERKISCYHNITSTKTTFAVWGFLLPVNLLLGEFNSLSGIVETIRYIKLDVGCIPFHDLLLNNLSSNHESFMIRTAHEVVIVSSIKCDMTISNTYVSFYDVIDYDKNVSNSTWAMNNLTKYSNETLRCTHRMMFPQTFVSRMSLINDDYLVMVCDNMDLIVVHIPSRIQLHRITMMSQSIQQQIFKKYTQRPHIVYNRDGTIGWCIAPAGIGIAVTGSDVRDTIQTRSTSSSSTQQQQQLKGKKRNH